MRHVYTVSIEADDPEDAAIVMRGMGEISGPKTVYQFEELSEDAQEKALDTLRGLRAASDWGPWDTERIEEDMVYALAEKLKAPGWDTDAPLGKIGGLGFTEWDVSYRQTLEVEGTLTPESAPGLPWPEDATLFTTSGVDSGRRELLSEQDEGDYFRHVEGFDVPEEVTAFFDAFDEAVRDALHAGIASYEYLFSDEHLTGEIEANEIEFLADGSLA